MALVRVNEHGRCVGRFSSRDLRKLRLGAGFIALKRVTERRAAAFSTAGLAWAAPHVDNQEDGRGGRARSVRAEAFCMNDLFTKAVRRELEPVWAADTQRRILAMGLWPKALPLQHFSTGDDFGRTLKNRT